jgi:hypothetical protein
MALSIGTRAELAGKRFRDIITKCWPSRGPEGTAVTFTVYRRGSAQARTDTGFVPNSFGIVVSDQAGVFYGNHPGDDRWTVPPEGQYQAERAELWTAYDVREGDNVLISWDDKMYLVEASTYVGSIYRCSLNSKKAQAVP